MGGEAMKNIMIIDDEERIRELQSNIIRSVGWKVVGVTNAQEATQILLKKPIDLVLLDINMPEVDGKQMFEIIEEYNPHIKVIVSSVYSVDKQKNIIPHATDYYDKSQGPFVLLTKIRHALLENDEVYQEV